MVVINDVDVDMIFTTAVTASLVIADFLPALIRSPGRPVIIIHYIALSFSGRGGILTPDRPRQALTQPYLIKY